ncbi:hypothetical protein [Tsukamurella sp. PLM1]|uniref:hypothetical protein n=1 Tax=Tsukamurella sp. PLM1 TaxID=2929795 RepID=UPI00204F2A97|nr:hypothetical protein [Tsukamurella sp. PLM1]BDH59763.1 hypothetical protein MTP03_47020 [Tsukamurella sp. PLM1]
MADLTDYERRGDPDAPFALTKKHERAQREAEHIKAAAQEIARDAPPLSPEQIATLSRIFRAPKQPGELMRWRLRLYCGHVVVRTAHRTHMTLHAAFTSSTRCPECGLDPALIIDGEAIGSPEEPPTRAGGTSRPREAAGARKPSRAQLEARVRELEAEVARLSGGTTDS